MLDENREMRNQQISKVDSDDDDDDDEGGDKDDYWIYLSNIKYIIFRNWASTQKHLSVIEIFFPPINSSFNYSSKY